MKNEQIEQLRYLSRKLVRELGMLELDKSNAQTTPGLWHSLIEIDNDPGISISKLGNLLLMTISTVSRLVKSLVKDKLVELKEGHDKREKYLHLTANGKSEISKINQFSQSKIKGAFELLKENEIVKIIDSIDKYSNALERSRLMKEQVKIATLSTSRTLRKQIIHMIADIQKNEFNIPITDEINMCVLMAEQDFYYNHSYNFWYVSDNDGKIMGSVGLKKIDSDKGEIKKFFVAKDFRGKGIAQKLMHTLLRAAAKHGFKTLYLGTVDKLKAAQKFYDKCGFQAIERSALPDNFEICHLDSVFFKGVVVDLITHIRH